MSGALWIVLRAARGLYKPGVQGIHVYTGTLCGPWTTQPKRPPLSSPTASVWMILSSILLEGQYFHHPVPRPSHDTANTSDSSNYTFSARFHWFYGSTTSLWPVCKLNELSLWVPNFAPILKLSFTCLLLTQYKTCHFNNTRVSPINFLTPPFCFTGKLQAGSHNS